MTPVLINKDMFEPSYNALKKFTVQNHNYFCTNLILTKQLFWCSIGIKWLCNQGFLSELDVVRSTTSWGQIHAVKIQHTTGNQTFGSDQIMSRGHKLCELMAQTLNWHLLHQCCTLKLYLWPHKDPQMTRSWGNKNFRTLLYSQLYMLLWAISEQMLQKVLT